MPHPLSCGEESWAITRDFNLIDTWRSHAVSAKTSWKYFIIIDDNLLTQEGLHLAQKKSVFGLLLMGKEERHISKKISDLPRYD